MPDKKRPVLVLTRNSAIAALDTVTVAPITSTIRSIPTEVVLTGKDGLPSTCAANFDNLPTVAKASIGNRITRLNARRTREAGTAITFALGLDSDWRVGTPDADTLTVGPDMGIRHHCSSSH